MISWMFLRIFLNIPSSFPLYTNFHNSLNFAYLKELFSLNTSVTWIQRLAK